MEAVFDWVWIVAAFSGGVFGAAIGALPAFVFTGFLVIAGEMGSILGNSAFTDYLAFGAVFGPHIAFGGGVAAAAFASKKGMHDAGRDILTPMLVYGARSDFIQVLIVGGIFGIVGHIIQAVAAGLGTPTDTIALGVWISAVIVRALFSPGKVGPFGKHDKNVAPSRFALPEDRSIAWIPFQSRWEIVGFLGFFVGFLSAWMTDMTGSLFIGFGISAASLMVLEFKGPMAVTHHMTLPSALAFDATGSLVVGAVFGLLGGLLGEIHARLIHNWGDTHIDSPAFSIFVMTAVVMLAL
jgi:hypothetical protein